jgi:hypothetical protein
VCVCGGACACACVCGGECARQCQVSTGEAARFVVEDDVARVEMAIHEPLRLEERQALGVRQSIMVSSRVCAAVPHNREGATSRICRPKSAIVFGWSGWPTHEYFRLYLLLGDACAI